MIKRARWAGWVGMVTLVFAGCGGDETTSNLGDDTATYEVTFNATWSASTHPDDFPSNPHFSGLIGAVHNDSVRYWATAETASAGIKTMAETGQKSPLEGEIAQSIADKTSGAQLSAGGVASSPGSATLTFEVSEDYPLVTLVSMVAPSPDWFVGVSSLSLRQGNDWIASIEVPLEVWDAGTDSGTTYTAEDAPTAPAVPISKLMDKPFDATPVVGTFTFTLK